MMGSTVLLIVLPFYMPPVENHLPETLQWPDI